MINPAQQQYQLTYEISPIILVNGIATGQPNNQMAIIQLTDAQAVADNDFDDFSDFFAHYRPAMSSSLIENEIGSYPFANQAVAANAILALPLKVSLIMSCFAQTGGGYPNKVQTMTNLVNQLNQHNQSGGTYIVATPSYIYNSCILLKVHDISRMDSNQPQNTWQWDFEQPLLTQQAAQVAYNSLMSKISGGLPNSGTWSGPNSTLLSPQPVSGPAPVNGVGGLALPGNSPVATQ